MKIIKKYYKTSPFNLVSTFIRDKNQVIVVQKQSSRRTRKSRFQLFNSNPKSPDVMPIEVFLIFFFILHHYAYH